MARGVNAIANLVLSTITILFSLFFLFQSLKLPFGNAANIGAGGWPTMILILLLCMGVYLLAKTIVKMKTLQTNNHGELPEDKENVILEPKILFPHKHWSTSGIILLYIIAISYLGFLLATPLFIFGMSLFLGMKGWFKLISVSLLTSISLVYVFIILLSIPLPRGMGVFRQLSLLFY